MLDTAIMDLHAPLNLAIDPVQAAERTCVNLLQRAADIADTQCCMDSTLQEYNTTQGFTPTRDGPSQVGQVPQRGRNLGMELDRMAPPTRPPPVIAKPTYSSSSKNLWATRYIASKLAGLQGEDLRKKQARLQELLSTAELQQAAMVRLARPAARDVTTNPSSWSQAGIRCNRHHRQTKAEVSTAGAITLQAGAVEITAPSIPAIAADSPVSRLLSRESRATCLGPMPSSWH
jgi:hypothetical protein